MRIPKTVDKKIKTEYFESVQYWAKNFEIRKDDDDLTPGDYILLKEWDGKKYTGRETKRKIKYVLRDVPEYGLMPGHCILGW